MLPGKALGQGRERSAQSLQVSNWAEGEVSARAPRLSWGSLFIPSLTDCFVNFLRPFLSPCSRALSPSLSSFLLFLRPAWGQDDSPSPAWLLASSYE